MDEFDEILKRERFIELVMSGIPELLAGFEVKWTPKQTRAALNEPDFAQLVKDAVEMREDGVEAALYALALKGNLGAIQMVLYNRRSGQWKDIKRIEVKNDTTISIGEVRSTKQAILELMREQGADALQIGRGLDEEILDVESSEA